MINSAYISPREDIQRMIPPGAKFILDVGCSTGVLGAAIKARTGTTVIGVEMSKEMAALASGKLDKVFVGDAAEIISNEEISNYQFDVIIFADVLEHLIDPWSLIKSATDLLSPSGIIVASLPNVRHLDTIYNLLVKGYWPYRDRGIHDKTHLRFFTLKNVIELFNDANLSIRKIETNYRIFETPSDLNRYARYIALPGIKQFLAFQYLISASKKPLDSES